MSILENRLALSEKQLVSKTDLYKRWEHATEEEITELCEAEKLRAYAHLKGPINGIIYCLPAYAWYDSFFHDEGVSYYSLEDVEACEKEYPDFIGIIQTPSNYEKKMGADEGPYDKNDEPFDVSKSTPWDEVVFPISLEELVDRWQCENDKIESLVKDGTLTAYDERDWIPCNGHRITRANKRPAVIGLSGPQEDIIFNLDEISVFEKTNPDFFESIREYIPAEELRKEMNLSPTKFVEFLRKNRDSLPIYGLFTNDMNFFYNNETSLVEATDKLHNIVVHQLDWQSFQQKASMQRKTTTTISNENSHPLTLDPSSVETQFTKIHKQIEELQLKNRSINMQCQKLLTEVHNKDIRIAELEQKLLEATSEVPEDVPSKTRSATEARTASTLDRWKEAFKIMVSLISDWKEDPPVELTRTDIERYATNKVKKLIEQLEGKPREPQEFELLSKTQRDFLRELMLMVDSSWVQTTPGAPPQE